MPSIAKGTLEPFTATGTYSDGTTQDLTTVVSWSTSSGAIATISSAAGTEGVAKGEGVGTATITATYPVSLIAGSTTLTVTAATLVSIDVTPANPQIAKGRTENFIATGTYSDGSTQDLTTAVSWSSSALSVATISNAAGSEGTASGVGAGMTTITATVPGMPPVSGSTTLTVTAAVLVSIDVSPVDPTMAKGTTLPLVATGVYSDGSTSDLTTTVTWSSTAPGFASVSNAAGSEGEVSAVAAGTAVVSATDPTTMIAGSVTVTVTAAVLNSIQINPTNPTIAKGTDQPFTATGVYSDGSTADLTTSVSWVSSVTTIATISSAAGSEGLATTVGVGTTTITATLGGTGISGSTTLTVSAATLVRIDVSPVAAVVPRSSFQDYTAIGIYSDSTAVDLTTAVTWSSSATSVATISNAAGSEGTASTVSPGTTTIKALDVASGISGSTTLTVTSATLLSIAVTPAGASLAKGGKLQYTAIGTYTGGFTRDITQYVSWSSSKPNFAGISNAPRKRGIATGKNAGMATITATDTGSGVSGSTGLTVTSATLVSIAITPMGSTIPRSTKQQYKAIGTYSDSSTADITTVVSWSSSNTAVATISNTGNSPGLASAIAAGTTTIGALDTNSGVSASTTLTVSTATLVSIALTPASPNIVQGLTQQMTATATYSDSSTKNVTAEVTWSTGNIAIASVSNVVTTRGVVTGIATGSTSVTATYPLTAVSGTTTVTVIP
jgi:hypothetical protein